MIVTLTAKGTSFFHGGVAYPGLIGDSKIFEARPRLKIQAAATLVLLFPQERSRAVICRKKLCCLYLTFKLFSFSIPLRVDRGIDREEAAVAAVS